MSGIELGAVLDQADERLSIDPAVLADNCLVIGAAGAGKTELGRVLLEQCLAAGIPSLYVDPTGDLTDAMMRQRGLELQRGVPNAIPAAGVQLRSVDVDVAGGLFMDPRPLERNEVDEAELTDLVTALLGLLGFRAKQKTPEFLLIETVVHQQWQMGSGVTLGDLMRLVIEPGVSKLGLFPLDDVISLDRREDLAASIRGLLASPGFADLDRPRSLSIDSLLGRAGAPVATVLSFAERSPSIRRFILAVILAKLKRHQAMNSSGRVDLLLYLDEAAEFFPRGERTIASGPLYEAMAGWSNPGVGLALVAESPEDLPEAAQDLCESWFVGRLPVVGIRRQVVEALDLVDPPVDEVALDRRLRDLSAGQFVLRTSRLPELKPFCTDL